MLLPVSTYRLQLHASFTLNDVENIIEYLHQLGISTIYASPIFAAAPGSMHGYDVSDPSTINPEIGTIEQLQAIGGQLQQRNMTWLQDVVPNHMVCSTDNKRLADVLERGPFSPYYKWFDIDWQHPDVTLYGRVMLPFLGKPLSNALQDNELNLALNENGLVITYFDKEFPLSIKAYEPLLAMLPSHPPTQSLVSLLEQLQAAAETYQSLTEWQQTKQGMVKTFLASAGSQAAAAGIINTITTNKQLLQQLLLQQYYALSFWQDCSTIINYRRFFAVNELLSLNISDEQVFNDYHLPLHQLYQQQLIQGVRIDHIDGLRDPGVYLNRLRQLFGKNCYIVVEKILEPEEAMPTAWPLQGTTGYEFCSQVNWLLTSKTGAQQLTTFYNKLFPDTKPYHEIVFEKKRAFFETQMAGDWENLVRSLYTLQLVPAAINRAQLKKAMLLFICCLPVYRLYPGEQALDAAALQIITNTFNDAIQREPELHTELNFLQSLWEVTQLNANAHDPKIIFLQRLMQFTGPAMAKGVEDTTFYIYSPLLAHNEVGDSPAISNYTNERFHQWMKQRQQQYPHSLNATTTHDTKRSEDGRIRLLALTWLPRQWKQAVAHWQTINEQFRTTINAQPAPSLQDEYFIYQSIIAGLPANGQSTESFIKRLQEYFVKSVREGKIYSNWQAPDTAYEEAVNGFIEKVLTDEAFITSMQPLFTTVLQYANVLALSQTLIKLTAPGVPDIYQGCELWNTTYVDPDNRQPVDYTSRKALLQELIHRNGKDYSNVLTYIAGKQTEGLQKLYVTWKTLQCRNKLSELFAKGDYLPLYLPEDYGMIAYTRRCQQQWILVVVPIGDMPIIDKEKDTYLLLPNEAPLTWTNEFTGELFTAQNNLPLRAVFNKFPVALLTAANK